MPAATRKTSSAAAAAAILLASSISTAADPWAEIRVQPQDIVGTLSCSAVSCHGGGGPRYWSGAAAGGEYVHWLGRAGTYSEGRRHYDPRARLESSNGDPHALAGQRISSSRFQEVLMRASQRADGSADTTMYQRCARCHDPMAHSLEEIPSPTVQGERSRPSALFQKESGISCETCHGGARQWIAVHYQRGITHEQLLKLGMVDTKNLFLRARLCASCHVGSTDNDMNHDMIAAGHPPLRFELASYEALIGTKHWDDRPQRAVEPEYEVQLWAAGRIATAEAALSLLEGRARRADRGQATPWPEFAEANCFSCHQPMRSLAGKPLPSPLSGKIAWQSWNLAMLNAVIMSGTALDNELPPAALGPSLSRLRAAMEQSFEPPPAEIANLAAAVRAALLAATKIDSRGRILDLQGHPLEIRAALRPAPSTSATPNWDDACQRIAALAAARRAIADAHRQPPQVDPQLTSVARSLRFMSKDREWPAIFATSNDWRSMERELDAIQRELLSALIAGNEDIR